MTCCQRHARTPHARQSNAATAQVAGGAAEELPQRGQPGRAAGRGGRARGARRARPQARGAPHKTAASTVHFLDPWQGRCLTRVGRPQPWGLCAWQTQLGPASRATRARPQPDGPGAARRSVARRARLREVVAQQRALGLDRKAGTDGLHVPEAPEQPVRLAPGADGAPGFAPRGRGFSRGGRGRDGGGRGRGRGRFEAGGRFGAPRGGGRFARGRGGACGPGGGRFGPPGGGRYGPPGVFGGGGGGGHAGVGGKRPFAPDGASAEAPADKRARGDGDGAPAAAEGLAELMAYGSDSEPDQAPSGAGGAATMCAAAAAQPGQVAPPTANGVPAAGRGAPGGRAGGRGRHDGAGDGGHMGRGGRGRGRERGRGRSRGRGRGASSLPPRRETLLQKLLAPDVRRERSALLQCLRFFAANGFLADPGAVRFPVEAPPVLPLREQLLGAGARPRRAPARARRSVGAALTWGRACQS